MKHPQIVILGFDEWLARQLQPLAAEHRWRLHDVRQPGAVETLLALDCPTVTLLQIDPAAESQAGIALLATAVHEHPDIAFVIISDGKLPDEDRGKWTASLMDLGAAFVLFPPLTGPVLEDLVGGLMSAKLAKLRPAAATGIIDLAEEGTVDA